MAWLVKSGKIAFNPVTTFVCRALAPASGGEDRVGKMMTHQAVLHVFVIPIGHGPRPVLTTGHVANQGIMAMQAVLVYLGGHRQ